VKVTPTDIPGVLTLEPDVFGDARGHFFESYNARVLERFGLIATFVQDNQSRSTRNVLRGLHYQVRRAQTKLVRVLAGEIFDVAVDIRRGSPTFGRSVGHTLSAANRKQLWIPAGFAHGFLVLSEYADVAYKTSDFWSSEDERCIAWNDPQIAIPWPLSGAPIVSAKDSKGVKLAAAELM
jgi:dTDP-4-dehydrorhamnose 3,5-epimerase